MPLNPAAVGATSEPAEFSWTSKDALLYAVSIGAGEQERTWRHVLTALAAEFGVTGAVTVENVCIDPKVQWARSVNLWHNAGIRTGVYTAATPLRWLRRRIRDRIVTARRPTAAAGESGGVGSIPG